jgi:zinc/manganese transport system substrate-binding protein
MIARRTFFTALLAATTGFAGLSLIAPAAAQPLKVVASFSILGDMVENVGGDRIALTTLVGPDGDAHVYEPTPADARAVAEADIVFVNGLEFEGWMERLLEASGYQGPVVTVTAGIDPIPLEDEDEEAEHAEGDDEEHEEHADHDAHEEAEHADHEDHHHHGEFDPHAWQDLSNGRIYIDNILMGLGDIDPEHAGTYEANATTYGKELAALDADIRATLESVPEEQRKVVTSHDAFGYFGRAYGIEFLAPVGMSTEAEPSAGEIAALIRQIREEGITAVFVENITDTRLIEQITAETNAKIGGTLYSDALSGPDGPAPSYLEMFRHNAASLTDALAS